MIIGFAERPVLATDETQSEVSSFVDDKPNDSIILGEDVFDDLGHIDLRVNTKEQQLEHLR